MAIVRCNICSEACKGDVLKVKDTFYHVNCFKCSVCGKLLAEEGYYSKDGKYYCRKDYKRLLSKICDVCGAYISGDMVSVLDKFFHHNCFYCYTCKIKFTPGMRVTYCNNNFYCSTCFTRSRRVTNTSAYSTSKRIHMAGDFERQTKTGFNEDTSLNVPQEAEAFGEKPIASNLSNQVQDDICSNFCKELAQRLAVQYLQCENHVADGTNFKSPPAQETEKLDNERDITSQSVHKSQQATISCAVVNSEKGDIKELKDSSDCQQFESRESKENHSNLNSSIRSQSFVLPQNNPPRQPRIRGSYMNYQRTGKVAAVVKFLEGLPEQTRSSIQTRGIELPKRKKRKSIRSVSDDQSVDSNSSDIKRTSTLESISRARSQDLRVKRSTASMTEHNFPVEVAVTPTSPYVNLEQTRNRPRDKYISHSQVVVTIHPPVSSTTPAVSSVPPETRQSSRFVSHSEHFKDWPPVQSENDPTACKRATFQPTPFTEATSTRLRQSSAQMKGLEENELRIEYGNQEKQRKPLKIANEWIDICEQDQSVLMDQVRQRNAESGTGSKPAIPKTQPSVQGFQKPYAQLCNETTPYYVNKIKPSAPCAKFGSINTWFRSAKWMLYGRKKKTSLQDLVFTAAKKKKQLQDKKQMGSTRGRERAKTSKKGRQPISQIIIHLFTATLVLFTVIGLLAWLSEMQQRSEQKQIQNTDEYSWTYGWKSQAENKRTQPLTHYM